MAGGLDDLTLEIERIRKQIRDLSQSSDCYTSLVEGHFANFIDSRIKPLLPEGYNIEDSKAEFSKRDLGYTIWLGEITNSFGNPVHGYYGFSDEDIAGKIWDLCIGYATKNNWVGSVVVNLELPN
ncbi:MAG: hypothetical protein ABH849_02535 [Nanoarchaeota archaeon]